MDTPALPTLAAYLRDSGGEAQDLSVPQQEEALKTWAAKNGLIITIWFKDEARPGSSTVGRDGFQAMIEHFRAGGCQEAGVVIWKMSRFSRDIDDAMYFRADLRRRGYKVISINDNIPDGPEGRFFEAAIDWLNARFLEDLSRDVKRGLSHLVRTYGAIPGTPPRGFTRQPVQLPPRRDGQPHTGNRWVPDPALAPQVRQAFEMRASGKTLHEINTTTRIYKSLNCYSGFFRNKLYIGILEYGDQTIEGYCEPIVDQTTWDTVQRIQAKNEAHMNLSGDNPHHPRRKVADNTYLLSGLAYCARCGSPLYGSCVSSPSRKTYDRYACSRAVRRRDCDLKWIPRATLENGVLANVMEVILDPTNLQLVQEQILKNQANQLADLQKKLDDLRPRLQSVRKRISNITDAIANNGASRSLTDKLRQLELEEADLVAEQTALQTQTPPPQKPYTPDQLTGLAESLRACLTGTDTIAIRKLLQGFLKRVIVDRNETNVIVQILYSAPIPPDG